MKKSVLSIIFTLTGIITIAQPSTRITINDADNKNFIAVMKQPAVLSEENKSSGSNFLVDNDRNSYEIVKIGNQIWMAENLRTTKLNNGLAIPLVSYYKAWSNLMSPGYCWYNNDEGAYKTYYGALYNGYTISTGKLCPVGWHVPTDKEWETLATYLGGESSAGGKLKETGTRHWISPNEGATNESGFTALPGGSRGGSYGSFFDEGLRGHWWSSTEYEKTKIWNNNLGYSFGNINGSSENKKSGLSVRCLKN